MALPAATVELSGEAKDENMMTMNYYDGGNKGGNYSAKTGLTSTKTPAHVVVFR